MLHVADKLRPWGFYVRPGCLRRRDPTFLHVRYRVVVFFPPCASMSRLNEVEGREQIKDQTVMLPVKPRVFHGAAGLCRS